METEEAKTIITILRHNRLVAAYLIQIANALEKRAIGHDASKFRLDEFNGFVQINRIAREHEYGSEEYRKSLREHKDVIGLHFSRNRHHPEHHEHGIGDMSLIDLIEMVCDWKAASVTYGQTSLEKSLEIQIKRFGLDSLDLHVIRLALEELDET